MNTQQSDTIIELATALNRAQSELGVVVKSTKAYNYNYADLASVMHTIKEPLANNGLAILQFPIKQDGEIGVETTVMHTSGEFMRQSFTVPTDLNNAKHPGQAAGSLITYCRRYAIQAVLCLPSADDDCFAANERVEPQQQRQQPRQSNKPTTNHMKSTTGSPVNVSTALISASQQNKIEEGIARNYIDTKRFCEFLGVDSVLKIPATEFSRAMNCIKKREATRAQEALN